MALNVPATNFLFEGIAPEEVTVAFLTDIMSVAEAHELSVDGISVLGYGE